MKARLWAREIQQHHVRALLHLFGQLQGHLLRFRSREYRSRNGDYSTATRALLGIDAPEILI